MSKIVKDKSILLFFLWSLGSVYIMTNFVFNKDFNIFLDDKNMSFVNVLFGGEDYTVPVYANANSFSFPDLVLSGFQSNSGSNSSINSLDEKFKRNYLHYNYKLSTDNELITRDNNSMSLDFPTLNQTEIIGRRSSQSSSHISSPNLTFDSNLGAMLSGIFKPSKTEDKAAVSESNGINSELFIASTDDIASSDPQKTGIDPGGDFDGNPIPVGDGCGFMIILAIIYAGCQWSWLKKSLCAIPGN